MIEDKISLALKQIEKLKQELKDIKKDMKVDEKIDSEEYIDLNKTFKDLKHQVKDLEEQWMLDLLKDPSYVKLKEMKMKKEEEIAHENQKLFLHIAELPPKFFKMNVDLETGPVRVEIHPEMRVYLNGKEEKKRV
jgi:hypothetical protein